MSFLNSVPRAPGVRSAFAVACGFVLVAPFGVRAADADHVGQVVVTATRSPTRISNLSADVTVIERDQIDASAGRSLADLLSGSPGIQSASNGGLGKNSSVFIRGGDAKQSIVLIDGVRYGSATTGAPSIDNIPLDQIERIEIVRGALASLYGADAASGVVQIFTRRETSGKPLVSGSATLGSDRYHGLSVGVSGGVDQLTYSVRAQTVGTAGFSATNPRVGVSSYNADRDGFRQQSLSANLGLGLSKGWRIEGNLLRSDGVNRYDDGVARSGVSKDTRAELTTQVAGIKLLGQMAPGWKSSVQASHTLDVSDTTVANKSSYLGRIATAQQQLIWENQIGTPLGTALVAVESLRQSIENSTKQFPVTQRRIDGLVLGLSGHRGAHDWQLSARRDRNSQFGTQDTGSIGYGVHLSEAWRLGGAVGTSFVAPSFNQLYWPGYGTPDLQPQRGLNKELSLAWEAGEHAARLTRYDNRIRDFILISPTSASNIKRVSLSGWTLSYQTATQTGIGQLYGVGSLDWLDAHNEADGSKLVRRADRFGTIRVGLDRSVVKYEVSLKGSAGAVDNNASFVRDRLPGYALWGASVAWRVHPDWKLSLRADNLGDRTYEKIWGYNQAGAQVFLTLAYAPGSR